MTTSLGLVDAFEKAAQIRRNRSRGLRDLSLFSPVAAADDGCSSSVVGNRDAATGGSTPSVRVTRDTRAEGSSSEPGTNGFGPSSSMAGETLPIPRDAAGAVLGQHLHRVHEAHGVSGLPAHAGRHVAASVATGVGAPTVGVAS